MYGNAPPSFPIQISFKPAHSFLYSRRRSNDNHIVGRRAALGVPAQEFDELAIAGPLFAHDNSLSDPPAAPGPAASGAWRQQHMTWSALRKSSATLRTSGGHVKTCIQVYWANCMRRRWPEPRQ